MSTNTETQAVVQATFAAFDALFDEIDGIIDVLPDDLDKEWLDSIDDGNSPWIEENESVLRIGFWDAGCAVIEAMLRAGYAITPPSK